MIILLTGTLLKKEKQKNRRRKSVHCNAKLRKQSLGMISEETRCGIKSIFVVCAYFRLELFQFKMQFKMGLRKM